MVVPQSKNSIRGGAEIPVIDLSEKRSRLLKAIVGACEEIGIFKVVNHGVSMEMVTRLDKEGLEFFSKPAWEKQQVGLAKPYGYGCKTIGFNGDVGRLEYLLLHNHMCFTSNHSSNFSNAASDYIGAVRDLSCDLLELVAEGLRAPDKEILSSLIRDAESDSLLRLNHYPPYLHVAPSDCQESVGFGEHTDPQILTILRSNDADGLQICTREGLWVVVPPDPNAFFVMVGDVLQVMTNGRFESIKHRVLVSSGKRRMSVMYFGAPPLDARISPLVQLVENLKESGCKYKTFTWNDYKKSAYASRLSDCRLNLFKRQTH